MNAMKKLSFLLVFAFAIAGLNSCQKNSMEDPADPYAGREAPQLPAAETFVMSFDGFDDPKAAPKSITNWGHSVANIVVWNTVLTVNLAIPTLAFHAAVGQEPEYQGMGVWLWAYEVRGDDGETYRAELYGELLVDDEVQWDMFITQVGGWGRLHWYTGITATDGSYATWTLNHNPENITPVLRIDYVEDNGNGTGAIRYTNIIPGHPDNGDYIEYREGNIAGGQFDRAYDVYRIGVNNLLEVNWDSVNKNGRVKDAVKFGDEDWHCWGTDLRDVEC